MWCILWGTHDILWVLPVNYIQYKMYFTGYHSQNASPSSQNLLNIYCEWYIVKHILYSVDYCSPQDIKCVSQDITHRIYHPLLRNLLRSVGYILWVISCGAQQKLCCPQDIKCDVQDITHRIYHPLLRNLVRNIGYVLWIYPVDNILYPVDNNRNGVAHRI